MHRDIKPGNVMLASSGRAKITDFGIARIETSSLTQAGTILGTPTYMSPEQFRGDATDARTDVYSAGILLFQLLTGEAPFRGALTSVMHKVLTSDAPAPSALAASVPPQADAIVRKAIAKRPEDRFSSAAAFAEAVRAGLNGAAAAPAPPNGDSDDATVVLSPSRIQPRRAEPASQVAATIPPPAPAVVRRSRLPAVLGSIAVLALLAGGAAWYVTRPVPPPTDGSAPKPAPTKVAEANTSPPKQPPGSEQPPAKAGDAATQVPVKTDVPASSSTGTAGPAPSRTEPAAKTDKPAVPPTDTDPAHPGSPGGLANTSADKSSHPSDQPPAHQDTPTATQPPAEPPQKLATSSEMLGQINNALHHTACVFAGATLQDSGMPTLSGYADAGSASALLQQFGSRPGGPTVGWGIRTVDRVFCPALSLLQAASVPGSASGPGLGLTLKDDRTVLQEDDYILPRITMPDYAGELRVDYLAHDGTMIHLYPTAADPKNHWAAQPARRFAPSERFALGDDQKKANWQSYPPFGTDMIIALYSSVPLAVAEPQNAETNTDQYLSALGRAIEAARATGARVSGALLLVDTVSKTN